MSEFLDNVEICPKCGSTDTKAILTTDNEAGAIWCQCGHINVGLSEGMEVTVIRVKPLSPWM